MNWRIKADHITRLILTETKCWRYHYPLRNMIMDMLRLEERINNPKKESNEFILSLPHYQDTLTIWASEYDIIIKEFNQMSFADYTSKILELEFKLENFTPRRYPEVVRILHYHWEKTEIWYLKDKRSLKYITDTLPAWKDLKDHTKLVQALFR